MARAQNDSPYWEVQGLSPSGTWHGVYQARDEDEGRELLEAALFDRQPTATMARYEDFRLSAPAISSEPEQWSGFAWAYPAWEHCERVRRARRRQAEQKAALPFAKPHKRAKRK